MVAVEIVYLCFFALLAGFVDSVVGGGGLVQIPALFVFVPGASVPAVLGTNKLAAIGGTAAASLTYARRVSIDWPAILPSAVVALLFSFLGARGVSAINSDVLRPLVLVLLVGVTVYTFVRKDFGARELAGIGGTRQAMYAVLIGAAAGFYDGFFGPGTGTFLLFLFVGVLRLSFLRASATTKVVNTATNLAALIYFVLTDQVLYELALPMAACNILGGVIGARVAVARGSGFVRVLFLVVASALILRFAYDILRSRL